MSDFLNQFLDPYERKSRLEPMLWALAPALIAFLIYSPLKIDFGWKSAGSILIYGMVAALLSRVARNAGKAKEEALIKSWGGWPSVILFRHSDSRIDSITKANIHKGMAKVVPGTAAPSPEFEESNAVECDRIYRAWSEYLRKLARNDQRRFGHVFKANINYGFWRNLYGVKSIAVLLWVVCVGVAITHAISTWRGFNVGSPVDLVVVSTSLVALFLWIFGVTSKSVLSAGNSYAARLLDEGAIDICSDMSQVSNWLDRNSLT